MNNHLLSHLIRDSTESSSESDFNNSTESSSESNSNNSTESSSEDEQIINISNFWYRNILFKYDEKRFRIALRMNKQTFWKIIDMIKNNLVFNSRQRPIELQLSVVLFLLGRKSTIWDIATRFEGFPNVIGIIDGTHIYLFEAPNKPNKDVYINRKRRYAIHVQGVVDHLGQFINYDIGWPASVHDAKAFGRLKNLFQFLKEIRTNDTKLATKFIDIALILHNIVERNNDIWILPLRTRSESRDVIRFVDSQNRRRQIEKREGMIKRQNLMNIVL
ncbi:4426_t:CDS:2 [Dentiscutata heterogama]|uniref:4426_t:CDS:1 n=1 Tax=Dentiscutata heterogama TaxID=1316150 RepID=A0ACA9KVJ7_9GLOM|nr:4426_t:CDS:2 [Dentiscutata heterogama]